MSKVTFELKPLSQTNNLLKVKFVFQELTRIELEHLCFLGPEELVHAFAKESSSGSSQSLPTDEVESEAQEARQRAARRTKNLQVYFIQLPTLFRYSKVTLMTLINSSIKT